MQITTRIGGQTRDYMMRICSLLSALAYIFMSFGCANNDPPAYLAGTESWVMTSEITGREYQISVALPRSYGHLNTTYPVLYALDANGQFGTVVETARNMLFDGVIPELIIVGIGYPVGHFYDSQGHRDLNMLPTEDLEYERLVQREFPGRPVPEGSGGAQGFLQFLREELIPLVENDYRTYPKDRALYGHSYGGLFAFYALLHGDRLFDKVIVGSPSLWWDNRVSFRHEEAFAETNSVLPVRAFFAVGMLEGDSTSETVPWGRTVSNFRDLVNVLEDRGYDGFELKVQYFEGETHNSVIPVTISRGLRYIYGE